MLPLAEIQLTGEHLVAEFFRDGRLWRDRLLVLISNELPVLRLVVLEGLQADVALAYTLLLKCSEQEQAVSQRDQILMVLDARPNASSDGLGSLLGVAKQRQIHQVALQERCLLARNDVAKAPLALLHPVDFEFVGEDG